MSHLYVCTPSQASLIAYKPRPPADMADAVWSFAMRWALFVLLWMVLSIAATPILGALMAPRRKQARPTRCENDERKPPPHTSG